MAYASCGATRPLSRISAPAATNSHPPNRCVRSHTRSLESVHGVPLVAVSQPTENTPAGRMHRRVLASMASFYTEQQSLDVTEGLARRAQSGLFVGMTPYGYRNERVDGRSIVKLDAAAAIVWGECSDCRPREFQPSFESSFSVGEVVDTILGGLKIPVLSGLTIGHTDDQLTLPIGVEATLDADKGELTVEESGVQ